jgi:hypothetical protein
MNLAFQRILGLHIPALESLALEMAKVAFVTSTQRYLCDLDKAFIVKAALYRVDDQHGYYCYVELLSFPRKWL